MAITFAARRRICRSFGLVFSSFKSLLEARKKLTAIVVVVVERFVDLNQ